MLEISANTITVLRTLLLISGFFIFTLAPITPQYMILGILALQLVLFLDTMDGAIARYNKTASFFGEALDFTLDHLSSTFIYFLVAGVLSLRLFSSSTLFWISLATVILAQLTAFIRALYAEHHIDTEHIKQENVALAFFHQDNMRLLLLALTVSIIAHFFDANALPLLVMVYFEFLIIKLFFLLIFLWTTLQTFPITSHLVNAYFLSFTYVFIRSKKIKQKINDDYADTLVGKLALRFGQ